MNAPFALDSVPGGRMAGAYRYRVAPPLERRRLQCYAGLMIADIVAILGAYTFAGGLYLGYAGALESLVEAQVLLPLFLTIGLYNNAYSVRSLTDPVYGIARALVALGIAVTAVVFIAFYTKSSAEFSRAALTAGALSAASVLVWMRLQMRAFINWRCGASVTNELVIDDGGPKVDIPGAIRIEARDFGLVADLGDPHALDRLGMILHNIDRVVVSSPIERRAAWAMMLKGANVFGEVHDESVVALGAHGARIAGGHGWLLVSSGPLGMRARAQKRALDLVVAGSAILLLAPLLFVVAIAIKLQDGGPVLFIQKRMGRGNRFFDMYKFRSMRVALADSNGTVSASRDDQRITPLGRFIRRTSIDELPQLFNVLRGEMSRRIDKVAVVKVEPLVLDVRVFVDVLDPRGVERRRAPLHPVDDVALLEQQPGEVRAVLPGRAGYEGNLARSFQFSTLRHRSAHVPPVAAPAKRSSRPDRTGKKNIEIRTIGQRASVRGCRSACRGRVRRGAAGPRQPLPPVPKASRGRRRSKAFPVA